MGCTGSAIRDQQDQDAFEERMKRLQIVSTATWDSFLDDVERLISAIEKSNLMDIARQATTVQDGAKFIRRIGRT